MNKQASKNYLTFYDEIFEAYQRYYRFKTVQIQYFPIIQNLLRRFTIHHSFRMHKEYQEAGLKNCNWKWEQYIHWPGIWIQK
jgi:hypothetical protein